MHVVRSLTGVVYPCSPLHQRLLRFGNDVLKTKWAVWLPCYSFLLKGAGPLYLFDDTLDNHWVLENVLAKVFVERNTLLRNRSVGPRLLLRLDFRHLDKPQQRRACGIVGSLKAPDRCQRLSKENITISTQLKVHSSPFKDINYSLMYSNIATGEHCLMKREHAAMAGRSH